MRHPLRSLLLSLSVLAGMAGAAVLGWHLGGPSTPQAAGAVDRTATVLAPPPADASPSREAHGPALIAAALAGPPAAPVQAPAGRAEDLPPSPEGPVASVPDLPPLGLPRPAVEVAGEPEPAAAGAIMTAVAGAGEPQPAEVVEEPATEAVYEWRPEADSQLAAAEPAPVAETKAPQPATEPAKPALRDDPRPLAHLASYRSEATALRGWEIIAARAGPLLAGAEPVVRSVEIPGRGRFVRLFARVPADDGCAGLRRAGLYCRIGAAG